MKFEDDGEVDDKIICAPEDDRNTDDAITSLNDIHPRFREKLEHHFTHYKDFKKPGSTKILGWGDAEEAKAIIKSCQERWHNK